MFERIRAATPDQLDRQLYEELQTAREAQIEAAEACRASAEELASCIAVVEKALAKRSAESSGRGAGRRAVGGSARKRVGPRRRRKRVSAAAGA